ncbi:MAG: hypothetical protein ACRDCE_18005 [Cetobacterium sp.]|uniref:hypothetical protein n=1 Tax=Cetobacterium sp. TaxID=2071632 RepID=UPI003EE49461
MNNELHPRIVAEIEKQKETSIPKRKKNSSRAELMVAHRLNVIHAQGPNPEKDYKSSHYANAKYTHLGSMFMRTEEAWDYMGKKYKKWFTNSDGTSRQGVTDEFLKEQHENGDLGMYDVYAAAGGRGDFIVRRNPQWSKFCVDVKCQASARRLGSGPTKLGKYPNITVEDHIKSTHHSGTRPGWLHQYKNVHSIAYVTDNEIVFVFLDSLKGLVGKGNKYPDTTPPTYETIYERNAGYEWDSPYNYLVPINELYDLNHSMTQPIPEWWEHKETNK